MIRFVFYVMAILYFLSSCQKLEDIFPQKSKLVLAPNKVTIQCVNCVVGEKLRLKDIEYEIVDNALLRQRVEEGAELDRLCTTLVTDMSSSRKMGCTKCNYYVSQVEEMQGIFFNCPFNQPIHTWCVSKIPTEPEVFSTNLFEQNKPKWGTCVAK